MLKITSIKNKKQKNNNMCYSIQKTFQHMVSGDTNPTGNCAVIMIITITLLGGGKEHATLLPFPPLFKVNMH